MSLEQGQTLDSQKLQLVSEHSEVANQSEYSHPEESEAEEEEPNEITSLLSPKMNRQLLVNQKNFSSSDEEEEEDNRSNHSQANLADHVREHVALQHTGTILSSCINISNTILGAGMLAMPSAISSVGLGLGILLIGFCASASAFGLFLLSRVAVSNINTT